MREARNINEGWQFTKMGETTCVNLPHTWNAVDGQDGGNDYYRGVCTYARKLMLTAEELSRCIFLEVNGAAMIADVRVNGIELGHHEGGFSCFRLDISKVVKEGENEVVITVDNRENDYCYPQVADFTFYGGIYRDVNLILTELAHFELVKDGTPGIKVTPKVAEDQKSASVTLEAWGIGGDAVEFVIDELVAEVALENGYAKVELTMDDVHLWKGTKDPFLYTAKANLKKDGMVADTVTCRFGCRNFAMDAKKGFLLNGEEYPLRGVSRHQDRAGVGNALSLADHREDMDLIREIGANTIRLAHYQHAQEFYDLCDEMGMVVWAEIPFITRFMPNGKMNTLSQMRELITQCYNHPSIVCWGLSNEITASGTVTEELLDNHRALNDLCHSMDASRPTVMAHAFMLEMESPLIPISDIASYNLYFGWYLGGLEQNEAFFDKYHSMYPDRVIGFSEYGADANSKFHSDKPEKGDYTEEYQCVYHEHLLRMIEERPYLWATHVWNMFDFAADGRDEGGEHGKNQKGLVTMDRKTKKDAFYLYKAHWNQTEPFVHICGSRFVDRTGETTKVVVYSNANSVELLVDHKTVACAQGAYKFEFEIPLLGEHEITAIADSNATICDSIHIRKVEKPNEDYTYAQANSGASNWFDQAGVKEGYYSMKDTLGDLLANPDTKPIAEQAMAKAIASRGDVAKNTEGNAALQAMIAKMPFEMLMKQAKDAFTAEELLAINVALQKVQK